MKFELADKFAEAYQGKIRPNRPYFVDVAKKTNNIVEFLEGQVDELMEMRYKVVDKGGNPLQNIIDGFLACITARCINLNFSHKDATYGTLRPLNDAGFATQSVAYTGTAGSVTGWNAGPQGVLVWNLHLTRTSASVTASQLHRRTLRCQANTPVPIYGTQPGDAGGNGGNMARQRNQIQRRRHLHANTINIR